MFFLCVFLYDMWNTYCFFMCFYLTGRIRIFYCGLYMIYVEYVLSACLFLSCFTYLCLVRNDLINMSKQTCISEHAAQIHHVLITRRTDYHVISLSLILFTWECTLNPWNTKRVILHVDFIILGPGDVYLPGNWVITGSQNCLAPSHSLINADLVFNCSPRNKLQWN